MLRKDQTKEFITEITELTETRSLIFAPCSLYCTATGRNRRVFAKILCPRITPIDANHKRVSCRNLGTFGVQGALALLSTLGSVQSDTKTCRTPKASRNRAEILSYSRSFVSFAG
jgi:hypothetical protein